MDVKQQANQKSIERFKQVRDTIDKFKTPLLQSPIKEFAKNPYSNIELFKPSPATKNQVASTQAQNQANVFMATGKAIEETLAPKIATGQMILNRTGKAFEQGARLVSGLKNINRDIISKQEILKPSPQFFTKALEAVGVKKKAFEDIWEGLGVFSTANDIIVQPIWKTVKINLARTLGQDVGVDKETKIALGEEPINLPEVLKIDPIKKPLEYQLVRFIDFAPSFIDPLGRLQQVSGLKEAPKFVQFARTGKIPKGQQSLFDDVAKEVKKGIDNFEKTTGSKLSKVEKDFIVEKVSDPKKLKNTLTELTTDTVKSDITPPKPTAPLIDVNKMKERRFAKTTVRNAPQTAPELKNKIDNIFDLYNPIKNKDEWAKARSFVDNNKYIDIKNLISENRNPIESSYLSQALIKKLQDQKRYDEALEILQIASDNAKKSGQAVQAYSVWGKLSPEGALLSLQKKVKKFNTDNKLVKGDKDFLTIGEDLARSVSNQATKIQGLEGIEQLFESARLKTMIEEVIPASPGQKLAKAQTLAQLLNPKTFIRNILGNLIFNGLDNVAQSFASPLDAAVSIFTKQRTVAQPNIKRQITSFSKELKPALRDALEGVDTADLASQYDIKNSFIFKSKPLRLLEQALNVVLKVPDRAFYQATYDDTLQGLMKLNKLDAPTNELAELAHYEGLRRTFQDDTVASQVLVGLKNYLNKVGYKGFGLGELILKYPKTPANLLVRASEYSPLGFVTSIYELARPLMGKTFNQREFVNNLSRATIGTGVLNLGAYLYGLGILTPKPDSDRDLRASQNLEGLRSYAFNLSALKRFVMTGFNPESTKTEEGDTLYSYDWAQPVSVPLAAGANIAEFEGSVKKNSFADKMMNSFGTGAGAVISGAETLTEQPLLTGIQTLFQTRNLVEGVINIVKDTPASFIPTIFNQINALTNNVIRETYDPNLLKASYNQAVTRIPLLSLTLPERKNILGQPMQRYQDNGNNIFNVMVNPGFISKVKNDPVLSEVIRLFETTGEKSQAPRIVDKKIKVNGEDFNLDAQQISDYQALMGGTTDILFKQVLSTPSYYTLPDTEKVKLLQNIITDANTITKVRLFGDNRKLSESQTNLINNNFMSYTLSRIALREDAVIKSSGTQGIKLPKPKKPKKIRIRKPKKVTVRKVRIKKPKKLKKIGKIKLPKKLS